MTLPPAVRDSNNVLIADGTAYLLVGTADEDAFDLAGPTEGILRMAGRPIRFGNAQVIPLSVLTIAVADLAALVLALAAHEAETDAHGAVNSGPAPDSIVMTDGSGLIDSSLLPAPPPATVEIKQTEVDFGSTPVAEAEFVVVDVDVTPASQIMGDVAYEAPTGKDLDELEMDGLDLKFAPGSGQFTLYARGLDGPVHDKFKINYLIG